MVPCRRRRPALAWGLGTGQNGPNRCGEAAVRVREVMSSPVVCVPPDLPVKEVADLLVNHRISAVPVVDHGELVGIVSEADLVPLALAPDPRAHLTPPADAPGQLPKVAGEGR